jgi:hypothetical protein
MSRAETVWAVVAIVVLLASAVASVVVHHG